MPRAPPHVLPELRQPHPEQIVDRSKRRIRNGAFCWCSTASSRGPRRNSRNRREVMPPARGGAIARRPSTEASSSDRLAGIRVERRELVDCLGRRRPGRLALPRDRHGFGRSGTVRQRQLRGVATSTCGSRSAESAVSVVSQESAVRHARSTSRVQTRPSRACDLRGRASARERSRRRRSRARRASPSSAARFRHCAAAGQREGLPNDRRASGGPG